MDEERLSEWRSRYLRPPSLLGWPSARTSQRQFASRMFSVPLSLMRPYLSRALAIAMQRYEERAENRVTAQHLPSSCIPGVWICCGDLSAPPAMR
jgi:hypothetical protein